MDYNKKQIKKQLRQEEALPEGFAWEDMQGGILAEMEAIETAKPATSSRIYWGAFAALSVMILFLSAYYFAFFNIEIEDNKSFHTTTQSIVKLEHTTISETVLEKEITASETVQLIDKEDITTVRSELKSTNTKHIRSIDSRRSTRVQEAVSLENKKNTKQKRLEERQVITVGNQNTSSTAIDLQSKERQTQGTGKTASSSFGKGQTTEVRSKAQADNKTVNIISTPYLNPSALSLLPIRNEQAILNKPLLTTNSVSPKNYFALELSSGINTWSPDYTIATVADQNRADAEVSILGYQYEVGAKYRAKNAFYATAGVAWQELHSRFKYEHTITTQIEQRDALVRLDINAVSNDTVFVYQDTTINVTETRNIQHYNKHRLITIPLVLGHEFDTEKLNIGLGVGGIFTINSKAEGRTLNADEIIDYDSTSSIYKENLGLALIGKIHLNYALTQDLYIGANVAHGFSLKNWSATDTAMAANTTSFSITLGKKL